jgi:hypothetical protein
MKIKFKVAHQDELLSVEGPDLTMIKVALILTYGRSTAIHIFQKKLEDSLLLYCPTEADLNNLVKRSFQGYVAENVTELLKIKETIK